MNRIAEEGYIYILRDNTNNNIIKVGRTLFPFERQRQLYNTSTPLPFYFHHLWLVDDMKLAEKAAHNILYDHRINEDREFFEILPTSLFRSEQRHCYDTTSEALHALIESIEDYGFNYWNIDYKTVDIRALHEHYLEGLIRYPEGPKGF